MKKWRVTVHVEAAVEVEVEGETFEEAEGWVTGYMDLLPLLSENDLICEVLDTVEI